MRTNDLPKLTRDELATAERVGLFLIPSIRDMVRHLLREAEKPAADATATFAQKWSALETARAALSDSASPMARVDLDLQMQELASKFAAAYTK